MAAHRMVGELASPLRAYVERVFGAEPSLATTRARQVEEVAQLCGHLVEQLSEVRNVTPTIPEGTLTLRAYRTATVRSLPALLWLYGTCWAVGGLKIRGPRRCVIAIPSASRSTSA